MAETRATSGLFGLAPSGIGIVDLDASAAAANYDLGASSGASPVVLNIVDITSGGSITSSDLIEGDGDVANYSKRDQVLAVPEISNGGGAASVIQPNNPGSVTPLIVAAGVVELARDTGGDRLFNQVSQGSANGNNIADMEWRAVGSTGAYSPTITYPGSGGGGGIQAPFSLEFRVISTGMTGVLNVTAWQSGNGGWSGSSSTSLTGPGWKLINLTRTITNTFYVDDNATAMAGVGDPSLPADRDQWFDGDKVEIRAQNGTVNFYRVAGSWIRVEVLNPSVFEDLTNVGDDRFDFTEGDVAVRDPSGEWVPGRSTGEEFKRPTVSLGDSDLTAWATQGTIIALANSGEEDPNGGVLYDFEGPNANISTSLTTTDPVEFPEGLRADLVYEFHTFVKKGVAGDLVHTMHVAAGAPGTLTSGQAQSIWTIDPITGVISQEHDIVAAIARLIDGAHGGPVISGRGNTGTAEDAGAYWKVNFTFSRNSFNPNEYSFYHYRYEYRNNGGSTTQTPSAGAIRVGAVHLPYKYELGSDQPYVHTFNATTDWTGPANSAYTLTIPQASHDKVSPRSISAWRDQGGGVFDQLDGIAITRLANGDIEINVVDAPDGRFAGEASIGD